MKLQDKLTEPATAMSTEIVSFKNVGLYFRRHTSFLDLFFSTVKKKRKQIFWALQDVSFQLYEGDTLGVVGRNGSGKSTFSMICAKIYSPDRGNVTVNGKIQLLALGVGFENQLSGRENVYINGSLLGLKHSEIKGKMDDIEAFADIGDFIDEPVQTYSSGMRSRLAFSIATVIRPDILILDEVLSTGDNSFRKKATDRIKKLHDLARCAIIISHNPEILKKLCNKVLWLEKGRVVMHGEASEVLKAYKAFCKNPEKWMKKNPPWL